MNYDFRYNLPETDSLNISFGINGMQQSSQNKGIEFLVPEYNLFDGGLFVIIKKSLNKIDMSGGIRFDKRFEHADGLYTDTEGRKINSTQADAHQKFIPMNQTFSGLSGSTGIAYQITEKVYSKFNISSGFRSPSIAELGSNGIHEGTSRYEIGNPNLKAEHSLQFDFSLGFNAYHISAEADLFYNSINNFVFLHKISSYDGKDSLNQGYSTFKFNSGNAELTGGEVRLDIHPHPLDWIHFENTFSYVHAILKNQSDSTRYLPFTPPAKFQSEIRFEMKNKTKNIQNAFLKLGVELTSKQDKIFSAFYTETMTPGFTLLNMGSGVDILSSKQVLCSIYISINNLTDVTYQSHLSRLKYENINYNNGRRGVYNMGRNVSFKMIIPINVSG